MQPSGCFDEEPCPEQLLVPQTSKLKPFYRFSKYVLSFMLQWKRGYLDRS